MNMFSCINFDIGRHTIFALLMLSLMISMGMLAKSRLDFTISSSVAVCSDGYDRGMNLAEGKRNTVTINNSKETELIKYTETTSMAHTSRINSSGVLDITLNDITSLQGVDTRIDAMNLELPVLTNFRSPCWYESLLAIDPYPADSHIYVKYHNRKGALKEYYRDLEKSYRQTFRRNVELFRQRLSRGEGWRLRCVPALYIIGVFKSGTSSLWSALKKNHPDMLVGPPRKEPQYWNSIRTGGGVQCFGWPHYMELLADVPVPRPFRAYVDLFDAAAERSRLKSTEDVEGRTIHPTVIADASPIYLTEYDFWQQLPGNQGMSEPKYILADILKSLTPEVKVIAILRNPVDRLYSQYLYYDAHKPKSPEDFHRLVGDALDLMTECLRTHSLRSCVYNVNTSCAQPIALKHSLYFPFVRDWLTVIGDNFLVLNSEHYYRHTAQTVNRIYHFIGLPSVENVQLGWPYGNSEQYAATGNMMNITRNLLSSFYRPYNRQLANLLGDERFLWQSME